MTILFDDGEIELRWISAFVHVVPEGFCEQGIVGVPQFRNGLRKETGRLKYFASLHKYAHAYIYIYIYIYDVCVLTISAAWVCFVFIGVVL